MALITILQFVLVAVIVSYLTINMLHIVRLKTVFGPLDFTPLVSVCVSARNEERSVGACLESLMKQDYPHVEVIAVDDHSEDATAEIIQTIAKQNDNLKFVSGAHLPTGWFGKSYALCQAASYANGEYFLFTDADPIFEPNAITSAVYRMQNDRLDVLTLMPRAVFGSFWERTIQPVIFAFIVGLTQFRKINDQKSSKAMGIGAFLMFRRSAYQKVGGHEQVKDCIIEDIALAKSAKLNGLIFLIADGKAVLSIRMYHSLKEIWVGWRKNIFFALKRSVFWTFCHICTVLGFQVGAYLIFVYNLFSGSSWELITLSGLGAFLVWVTGTKLCDELKISILNAVLFPLGAFVMVGIILNSMVQSLFKGTTEWRGRVYPD